MNKKHGADMHRAFLLKNIVENVQFYALLSEKSLFLEKTCHFLWSITIFYITLHQE